jgi:hypothetical protein
MHFSWKALLVAPLILPLIGSLFAAPLMRGDGPIILTFLTLLVLCCVISYGTMLLLFLPALLLLSLMRPLTRLNVHALGALLGVVVIVPFTLFAWATSGPDSGPPSESVLTFFVRWVLDPFMLFFPAAGLVTAALYWWLATRQVRTT